MEISWEYKKIFLKMKNFIKNLGDQFMLVEIFKKEKKLVKKILE